MSRHRRPAPPPLGVLDAAALFLVLTGIAIVVTGLIDATVAVMR